MDLGVECFKECWPVTADIEGSEGPAWPRGTKGDGEEDEGHEEPEEELSYPEDPDEELNLSEVLDLTVYTIPNGKYWKCCLNNLCPQVLGFLLWISPKSGGW